MIIRWNARIVVICFRFRGEGADWNKVLRRAYMHFEEPYPLRRCKAWIQRPKMRNRQNYPRLRSQHLRWSGKTTITLGWWPPL